MPRDQALDFLEVPLLGDKQHQALEIPVEFSFDTDRVRIYREGERLIIEPVRLHPLCTLLDSWEPLPEDHFPFIEDHPPESEELF